MNVAYVNPFIVATLNVFRSMVHVPIMLGRPYLKDRGDRLYKLCKLSATIGLSGAASGVVILSLPEAVAVAPRRICPAARSLWAFRHSSTRAMWCIPTTAR